MASMASECWEKVVEEAPEINGALLMALMDETHVEEAEDERLGCVIQSLEEEIGQSAVGNIAGIPVNSEYGNYQDCTDCGLENMGLLDGGDFSGSTCHISDPFDWVDVDMAHNWYLDTCGTNEVGIVGYGFDDLNVRECSSYYNYYGDASINEDAYSPLWQES